MTTPPTQRNGLHMAIKDQSFPRNLPRVYAAALLCRHMMFPIDFGWLWEHLANTQGIVSAICVTLDA